ncbi:hypothetical protein BP6252_12412 [Coleophoma cylindrospora]|uniref:Uncharacterized protein n=1 Tax=Coleophoma cylindrospora TaxID=1849047 RepID=A0A3D8QGX3_9HELO|nr:hypothetical protein BP6252_12412 [Coleophoma cylindrospora]
MPTATDTQVQEPPTTPKRVPNLNTGFPEPFNHERNTTLPHPDADTSVGAVIEGPEIALSRTHSRKISFLSHRSKHSNASGKLDPSEYAKVENNGLYDNIQYADGSKEEGNIDSFGELAERKAVVIDVPETEGDGEAHPIEERGGQDSKEGGAKKGFLKKSLHRW